jgi:hypothetical protein
MRPQVTLQAAGFLLDWHAGHDNFGAQLMALIAKADLENLARLAAAFPDEVATYAAWRARPSPSARAFFDALMAREAGEYACCGRPLGEPHHPGCEEQAEARAEAARDT